MSTFILIGASIALSIIVAYLIFKKFNILTSSNKSNSGTVFLSDKDALKVIVQKAKLTEEEKEHLEILFSLVSGSRIHQGFEDKEIANRWLVTTRRAISNSSQFDQTTKDDLEFSVYEIYRKINNERMLTHPSVRSVSDLNIGQPITIQFTEGVSAQGIIVDSNFYSLTVDINEHDSANISSIRLEKKVVSVSLWKIMDAQYHFQTKITAVDRSKKNISLILSNPKKIVCAQIRSHPRQDVEIPIKFRQATLGTDPNTGALQDIFGGVLFGIINNIGPWGCSIVSQIPIPLHTTLRMEIPLFDQILTINGSVKNVTNTGTIFMISVEFNQLTPKSSTLLIYHYLFAKDSSN